MGKEVDIMKKFKTKWMAMFLAMALAVCMAACDGTETGGTAQTGGGETQASADAPGKGATKIGVLLVGTRDDYGYNQALYEGCLESGEELGVEVLIKESVPEDSSSQAVMEQLIAEGCTIIYASSYGHREYAELVAAAHPEVAFFCSNETGEDMDNVSALVTYGWDSAYINGICAGLMTKTNEIGYIGSFQVPVVMYSVDAFALGVQSVNPDATVHVVFTGSWDDVGLQTDAVNAMASQNIDCIAQYQDYTKTICEMCEAAGIYVIGYHVDASDIAPNTFLTGTIDICKRQTEVFRETIEGNFPAGIVSGGYPEGMVANAECSDVVPDEVKAQVDAAVKAAGDGSLNVYAGPVYLQDGSIVYEEGYTPTTEEILGIDFLVQGTVGLDN